MQPIDYFREGSTPCPTTVIRVSFSRGVVRQSGQNRWFVPASSEILRNFRDADSTNLCFWLKILGYEKYFHRFHAATTVSVACRRGRLLVKSITVRTWLLFNASVNSGSWLQMTTISPLAMHSWIELLNKLAICGSVASRKSLFRPIRYSGTICRSKMLTDMPLPNNCSHSETAGLLRTSSVPALKASPMTDTRRTPVSSTAATARERWSPLLEQMLWMTGTLTSRRRARNVRACRSLGRQEPPYAKPGLR